MIDLICGSLSKAIRVGAGGWLDVDWWNILVNNCYCPRIVGLKKKTVIIKPLLSVGRMK